MLGKYISAVKTARHTTQARSRTGYVIRRKHSLKPAYYAVDWGDYKWVSTPHEATVFYSKQSVDIEIKSTCMQYEAYYEVVEFTPCM